MTEDERREGELANLLERFCAEETRDVGLVERYAHEHPAFADDIRRLFPAVVAIGGDEGGQESRPLRLEGEALSRLRHRLEGEERFQAVREIGQGGQGVVLAVHDGALGRELAMKILLDPREEPRQARAVERFLAEAELTARLDHPGIVPVHDLGVDEEGRIYFTMKLVEGRDLGSILTGGEDGQPEWPLARVLDVILRACEAMAFAHSKNIIHRDLKPSNIRVGSFGEVYVMDWGLAHARGVESRDVRIRPRDSGGSSSGSQDTPLVTMAGDIVGTPAYMSPEQALGDLEAMGPHSDVYSVGAILYHLLSGAMPYAAAGSASNHAIWNLVRAGPPTPVHRLAGGHSAELVAITEKAMARAPEARYADMSSLAEDLRAYLEGRVVQAHRTGPLVELGKWMRRNKLVASLGIAVIALVMGGLGTIGLVQAHERGKAEREREVAQAIAGFLNDDVLRAGILADHEGRGLSMSILEVLQLASDRLGEGDRFEGQPLAEAGVRDALGGALWGSDNERALPNLERAYELRLNELGQVDSLTLRSLRQLGGLYTHMGRYKDGEDFLGRVWSLRGHLEAHAYREAVHALSLLGNSYFSRGLLEKCERALEKTLAMASGHLDASDSLVVQAQRQLGQVMLRQGRTEKGTPLIEAAFAAVSLAHDEKALITAVVTETLGDLRFAQGHLEEAERLFLEALETHHFLHGDQDPRTRKVLQHVSNFYRNSGRAALAKRYQTRLQQGRTDPDDSEAPSETPR